MMKKKFVITAAALLSTLSFSTGSFAESPALEEIVVTARKRAENLQDVGVSVSALSQTEIDRQFARDITDLASISPNLIIDDTAQGPGGVAAIFLRGVGVADVEKNFDPAVGVVADGIFIGANSGSLLRSIDIASIEVLRGPQGTLFGRNTIGGLINVKRTQPTKETGGKFRVGAEDYDTNYADVVLNLGNGEDFGVKLTGAMRNQREGFYTNYTRGSDEGSNDYRSFGVNILWDATDDLTVEYSYQEEEVEQDTPPLLNTGQAHHLFCFAYGYCSPSQDSTITGDRYGIMQVGYRPGGTPSSAEAPFQASLPADLVPAKLKSTFDSESHTLELGWDVSDSMRVDYIYGRWESDETILSSWDGTPEMLYGTDRPAQYEQDSHELRLTYDAGGALSFVAGAYIWDSEYAIQLQSYIGFAAPGLILDLAQFSEQDTESRAIFFEADYRVTEDLKLSIGGRYTRDEKESRQFGMVNTSLAAGGHPSEEWNEFTPRVTVTYNVSDNMMMYATFSNGYRSGGFNGRVGNLIEAIEPYDPETVDNYEIGLKSEWMDNRLRFNANVFFMDYDDKQEELQLPDNNDTGQKTVVTNASTAEIKGLEIDIQAYLYEGLTLRANLGYLDTSYDEFGYTALDGSLVDLSNLEFRRAPEWTGTIDATYEKDIPLGTAWARLAYHHIGSNYVNVTNAPELENEDQNLVDFSLNVALDNGITNSLFGRNLTDEDGYTHGYDVAGLWSYASVRPPRTYGAEIAYTFGK